MTKRVLGVIGGSGLYGMNGIEAPEWRPIDSPWGTPSDEILFGRIGETEVRFLPRHGRAHTIPPGEIDYRANIDAMKRAGATDILSVSACGSLREDLPPGRFVLVDQFIDKTRHRSSSFFGKGCVAHVPFAYPVSAWLGDLCEAGLQELEIEHNRGGTYLAMEGPQFSTQAESNLYRQWGCDVIGMTNMPEAKLAREAEIRYGTIAMVTDYDCWHPDHGDVDIEMILTTLRENTEAGARLVEWVARHINTTDKAPDCGADTVLDTAIITPPEHRDPAVMAKLDAIVARVLKSA